MASLGRTQDPPLGRAEAVSRHRTQACLVSRAVRAPERGRLRRSRCLSWQRRRTLRRPPGDATGLPASAIFRLPTPEPERRGVLCAKSAFALVVSTDRWTRNGDERTFRTSASHWCRGGGRLYFINLGQDGLRLVARRFAVPPIQCGRVSQRRRSKSLLRQTTHGIPPIPDTIQGERSLLIMQNLRQAQSFKYPRSTFPPACPF